MIYIVECEITNTKIHTIRAYVDAESKKQAKEIIKNNSILDYDIFDEELTVDNYKEKILSITKKEV